MWQILRPQVKALLDTVSLLQETAAAPKVKFDGYPAAHIVPSENTGDYETNKENIRTYAFTIRCFYETKSTGIEAAIEGLEEVVDQVIDTFDEEDLKQGNARTVGVGLPANKMYINIFAAPSRWGELPEDELVMAEILVKIRISVDVS